MTAALEQHDWSTSLAQRTRALGGGEITAILALAGATDVITFSGGFPDPATFPTEVLAQIAARLITGDAAVCLNTRRPRASPGSASTWPGGSSRWRERGPPRVS